MLRIIPVNIKPVRHRLTIQNRRHLHVLIQTHIPIRRAQHNFHLPVARQKPVVILIGQIIRRTIEVAIVVIIPIQKLMDIERPAHAHAMRDYIRMLQRKIHRMVSPKAAARHGQPRRLILPAYKRHHLMQNVALVLQMPQHPHLGMHALVVPTLGINSIGAKYLQFAALDFRRQHANHPAVFIFEKLSHGGRKHQQRSTRIPKNQSIHVPVQFLAITFVIFAIHSLQYLRRSILPEPGTLRPNFVLTPKPLSALQNDIVIRDMSWTLPKLVPRSAPLILLILTLAAAVSFAGVGHLVARFNANQQARGRKLYAQGLAEASASRYDDAIAAFRAALTCDPTNSQYQLSLARALRDSNDPRLLDEAESYLLALWQRTPQDAAVNLALARVQAHRGSIEDATRYYHNAMYGVWKSDSDANRTKARIELIQFLLKKDALDKAESEMMALAAAMPPDVAAHLQAAQLFEQAHDYANALAQYQEVLRIDLENASALAGAGQAAYRTGNYATAGRYLEAAVKANSQDADSRRLLATTDLILRANPFQSHISDAERNRRITAALAQAEKRLAECAQQTGVDLKVPATVTASPLSSLESRVTAAKPNLARLRSPAETDLPDTIMDVVFQTEQQTAAICGPPQGLDLALLLISQKREAASR